MLTDTASTALGRAIVPRVQAHPGLSGLHPLLDANDAFAARLLLTRAAEKSLDVQYYIWHADLTGILLFDALRAAADRGVRVRFLLDDNNGTAELDRVLAALGAHPNVEVRLFNPFAGRGARWLGYLTDFSRLNRRMHNKSFTADNQATIVGGRNVGDEYFAATDGVLFADLDVVAIGPVVGETSRDFDRYWASDSSYPIERLVPVAERASAEELALQTARAEGDPRAAAYIGAIRRLPFVEQVQRDEVPLQWAPTRLISDDPDKGLSPVDRDDRLIARLAEVVGDAKREVDIVSPYFVPAEKGTDALVALAARGVRIRVLTNSLEATDVAAVHAGYVKRRRALLEAGIELYELKRAPGDTERPRAFGGSSGASLHAKTFSVDRRRLFIGSFNFDQRSIDLNTELGFLIDSPVLAGKAADAFETSIPERSYRVTLTDRGELEWTEQGPSGPVVHRVEPGTKLWQRAWVRVLSVLPIDWLL